MTPKKILFANVPADGHFNPLIRYALFLKEEGHEVAWYTQSFYQARIEKMGIPFFPFVRPPQLNQENFEHYFAERVQLKDQLAKLKFDLEHIFIRRGPEFYRDLEDIQQQFPFDLVIADVMFTGIPFIKHKLGVPVISVGVVPVAETSRHLAPAGLGMLPPSNIFQKGRAAFLRTMVNKIMLGKPYRLYHQLIRDEGIKEIKGEAMFDVLYKSSDLVLQSGTPGFEFDRPDLSSNIRFAGPLVPPRSNTQPAWILPYHLRKYPRRVLVTQGTVEKDPEKLLVPTLNAFRNSDTLVIVTTGGSRTQELKMRFPDENFLIEDFIPFNDVMPYCQLFITNGGYGGVMLGIENKLPLLVAGIHEGKNEINARIGYFKLGINLRTEYPSAEQIRQAAERILVYPVYRRNVTALSREFAIYEPERILLEALHELEAKEKMVSSRREIQKVA